MALGLRGSNPIWAEFDLSGKIFDDTYYMWVLDNEIPYAPAIVYHDPDLSVAWTQPIQFLANGTLPVDIFFESEKVYRLEFRQTDGLSTPTQQDPLIYLVENYVAGEGGSSPVDTIAFASTNQVTNPQFALINFTSPYTFTGTDPSPLNVGSGWVLEAAGTGTVTLSQVALNDTNANPSNAPYALRITASGWTAGSLFLRQRFNQNGMLWANKIVSSTITAQINGAPQPISANLVDSNGATLGTVLTVPAVNEEWNEFTGHDDLPATTNPDIPPAAYIDYKLALPSNIDIFVTSIQLISQDLPLEPNFEQDSIDRQIDYTYHTAYPIVPVGTIIDYAGYGVLDHYLLCDGTAYLRNTYQLLLAAITLQQSVTLTMGLNTFTMANASSLYIGIPVEGTGIPANTTVTNIVGTTVTMSNNASASGTITARFFPWGDGDGSTTFNAPNLQGYVTAGAAGSLFTTNGVGNKGGSSTVTLTGNNMPNTVGVCSNASGGNTDMTATGAANVFASTTGGTFAQGGGQAFSIIQQTALVRKFIRFE